MLCIHYNDVNRKILAESIKARTVSVSQVSFSGTVEKLQQLVHFSLLLKTIHIFRKKNCTWNQKIGGKQVRNPAKFLLLRVSVFFVSLNFSTLIFSLCVSKKKLHHVLVLCQNSSFYPLVLEYCHGSFSTEKVFKHALFGTLQVLLKNSSSFYKFWI